VADYHIFTDDIIGEDYHLVLKQQLGGMPANTKKIIHHIQSPGGSVYGGYKGYHLLKSLGVEIESRIEGEAQSMATFIALAGKKIVILDPSIWMIHNPSQGLRGDADMLRSGADELLSIENAMAEAYAQRSGKTVDVIKQMMKAETRMTAKEAVDFGFADEIGGRILEDDQYKKLKAVAFGSKEMEDNKDNIFSKALNAIDAKLNELSQFVKGPKALDLSKADGTVLVVQSEDGQLVGKTVTVNGQPAPDGEHQMADGSVVVVAGGVITSVTPPMTEQAKLEQQIAALNAQLDAAKAATANADAQKVELETKLSDAAAAMQAIKKDLEAESKKVIGDNSKPDSGAEAVRKPVSIMNKSTNKEMAIRASRTFLAENMPWLEKRYKNGCFADGTSFSSYREGGPNAASILEVEFNYTYDGLLSTDLFFKPTIGSPALADVFNLDLGAKNSKKYHIAPVMNKILKPYTGCDQAITNSSFNLTSKGIQLKPFQMYEGWCKDDFTEQLQGKYNVLAEQYLKSGNESFDPAGTPIDTMIVDLLKDALRRDIWRRVSFADLSSSSADWNQFDGFWQALIDSSGASNYCVNRIGSSLGTGTLSAGTALSYFQNIVNNSPLLLKQQAIDGGKGQFLVTRSVWENYYNSLIGTGAVTEQQFTNAIQGISNLTYLGIPVKPISIWDDHLSDSTNPLAATTKHLIAFTIKENHVLGVEDTADMEKIDSWFEKKDNKRYYRSNMTMGFLPSIHCDLTAISY